MNAVGSFTVEFHEHLPRERFAYVIAHLQAAGARVEEQTPHRFVLLCENESQVKDVGVWLFQTHVKSLLTVTAASGVARASASAYPYPKARAERKR
jgi:hypothetical protein